MKRWTLIILLSFSSTAGGRPVSPGEAAEQADSLVTYLFEEVVVYGRRSPAPPSMISEIDTSVLRRRNGSDVADVLRETPGLYVSTGTKGDTRTGVRGFGSSDVLVLVDGYPVNTGYYGKVDLSMIPVENIARIKVLKGPVSAAYGANSMGGVINIITRSSFENPLTSVAAEGGGENYYRLNLNHGRTAGRFSYSIFAYHRRSDGFRLSDSFRPVIYEDGGVRENSHYRKSGGTAKFGMRYSDDIRLGLGVGIHTAERGCPPGTSVLEPPRYSEFPEWRRMNLNINGNFCLSANCSFKTVLFVDSQSDRYVNYSSSEMSGDDVIYDSLLENWTVGGSVKFSLEPWRRTQVKTGLNFRRDLMNKKPDVDERWYSHGNHTFTLFNEIAVLPWSGTSITAALGMHFFSSERFSEMAAHLSPMVSLSRTLPWRFRVYGSWANSVRYPTMHQLYSTASGNPALEPEEADKIEIGLEKTFFSRLPGRGEVRLAWFDNGLNNLIYRAARTYVYENIRDATLRGFEGSLTWFPAERFSVRAAYAVMDVGSSTEELLEDLPVERFSLELSGRTGFGTEVHFSFNRHLGIGTHIDSITLPDYDLFNLSISRKLSHGIRITLRANNLLDENYLEEPGYPGPGREILGGLSWTR